MTGHTLLLLTDFDGRHNQLAKTVNENMNKITSLTIEVSGLKEQVTALETKSLIVTATLNAQTEINNNASSNLREQGKEVSYNGTTLIGSNKLILSIVPW